MAREIICPICSDKQEKLFGPIYICPRCDKPASSLRLKDALNSFIADFRIDIDSLADALGERRGRVISAMLGNVEDDDPIWQSLLDYYGMDWTKYLKREQRGR